MEADHVAQAEKYYQLIGEKNFEKVKEFLNEEVEFFGPLATLKGKEAVIKAIRNFTKMFNTLKIRAKLGNGNQAMIVYDIDIPGIVENFPGASLLSFHDGLIVRIELFYDGSRFIEKRDEIFS